MNKPTKNFRLIVGRRRWFEMLYIDFENKVMMGKCKARDVKVFGLLEASTMEPEVE